MLPDEENMSNSCYYCIRTGAKSCEPHCGLCEGVYPSENDQGDDT